MRNEKSFHFDLGNSTVGPIGMCARINAETPEEALERLMNFLPREKTLYESEEEYITIYFNPDGISVEKDITEGV